MNCTICEELNNQIQLIQNKLEEYLDLISYAETRINYLTFIGINRIGRRPYEEQLSVYHQLYQLYSNYVLANLEDILRTHQSYHQ